MNDLIENTFRLHTTEMGAERIKRNLQIDAAVSSEVRTSTL